MAKPPKLKKHMFDVRSDPSRPHVRSATIRKSAKDGGWTKTEQAQKSRLMRQFSARNKGYAVGISDAYRDGYDGIDWSSGATADDLRNSGGKK